MVYFPFSSRMGSWFIGIISGTDDKGGSDSSKGDSVTNFEISFFFLWRVLGISSLITSSNLD